MNHHSGRLPKGVYWRRRLFVLMLVVVALLSIGAIIGGGGATAEAGLASEVAGQAVLRPGDTLWELAAETAPDGISVHQQLRAIQDLNGLRSDQVPAWTIVLLPGW
ncbi:MAG: LysM peptidoglycan-binding domain-containing protein [Nitriliruptorales bacterium]|nr:LysM peptidoglycan-binding domain-containing protein [Nitriliruptorales bacterium]